MLLPLVVLVLTLLALAALDLVALRWGADSRRSAGQTGPTGRTDREWS